MSKLVSRLAAVLLLTLGFAAQASAHTADISTGKIAEQKERVFRVDIGFLATDLERIFQETQPERAGVDVSAPGVLETELGKLVKRRVSMQGDEGRACSSRVEFAGEDPTNADSALIVLQFDCTGVAGQVFYNPSKLLDAQGRKGKHLVTLEGANAGEKMLYPGDQPLDLSAPLMTTGQLMWTFLEEGVKHILTGYDHVAFLLAILLWATRVWPVVKIVTAFTISHSVTLSLAALNIVTLPSDFTEAAIAASIVYVAVENFVSNKVDRRWRDTFFFGFIHGFGFASSLMELGVPQTAVVPALAAFNIGVEIGQVAIVLVFVPVMVFAVDRATGGLRNPRIVQIGSALVALLGAYWLLERAGLLGGGLNWPGLAVGALLIVGVAYLVISKYRSPKPSAATTPAKASREPAKIPTRASSEKALETVNAGGSQPQRKPANERLRKKKR